MDPKKETVVFVEFNNEGSPHQVITSKQIPARAGYPAMVRYNDYDFALSKKYGLLYHEAGGLSACPILIGQTGKTLDDGVWTPVETVFWAAPGVEVNTFNLTLYRRLEVLPEAYTPEKLFDPYGIICCEYGIIWCSECQDCMPDYSPDFCEHVWYCRACGETSVPDERCGHEKGAEGEW